MRQIKIITLVCVLYLVGSCAAAAEDCKSLENVGPDGLVSYLEGTLPNDGNAECVTYAIKTLAQHRYKPAIPMLVKLLDFRRPPNAHEKNHVLLHPPIIEEMYPAAAALEEIGTISKSAAPAVLSAIGSTSSSATARENAVAVWMELHKYQSAKGVTLLKQEAIAYTDPAVKENLRWALSKAPAWCNPKDKARCRAAAALPKP
jgi:hypothetical protein